MQRRFHYYSDSHARVVSPQGATLASLDGRKIRRRVKILEDGKVQIVVDGLSGTAGVVVEFASLADYELCRRESPAGDGNAATTENGHRNTGARPEGINHKDAASFTGRGRPDRPDAKRGSQAGG